MNASPQWPRTLTVNDAPVTIRLMEAGDADAVLAFARALPSHDLLFLQRDIRNPKVVAAWIEQIERGLIRSLLAVGPDGVVGCAAIVRDELSWSPHVAEIRILTAPGARGGGLGRALAQDSLAFTQSLGVEKVRLTGDKLEDKEYQRYSLHPGGQTREKAKNLKARKPHALLEIAVKGMLPKTRLGDAQFNNLHVVVGSAHKHEAQKPRKIDLNSIK